MNRLRRLRKNSALRDLVAQIHLSASNLVLPYFVGEGSHKKEPIASMPGIERLSPDELLKDIEESKRLGINSVILFGLPKAKDNKASGAYQENGVTQKAVAQIKKNFADDLVVITDVCLCGYTKHGHCGIIKSSPQSTVNSLQIDNDETLKVLSKIALSHAQAGADIVAPSSMMDGQVSRIRKNLDENGFRNTAIMGYSAKFASSFYGPFREAADSAMKFGDRKSYQMDYRNSDEALREIEVDIQEGADIVMVKPALAYLDIIAKAKERFNIPFAAFNVSGEYAMVKAYCERLEVRSLKLEMEKELVLEILTAIKRAGADILITYWAKEAAGWISNI